MKIVEVMNNGHDQSLRLPDDCHLESSEVFVKRIGRSMVLIPKDVDPWQMLAQSLEDFTNDYMEERVQPPQQSRKAFFK